MYDFSLLIWLGITYVVLMALLAWRRSPKQKGKRGEQQVAKALATLPQEYYIYNDIVLRTYNGTTQIDHIVVSPYGIFAIETKNYRGEIYGSDEKQEWKQIIKTHVRYRKKWWKTYTYTTKNTFYNPVMQSKGHVAHILQQLPQTIDIPIVSIVVFSYDANLSGVHTSEHVLRGNQQLLSCIRSYQHVYATEDQLRKVRIALYEKNVREVVDEQMHVQNVRLIQQRRHEKINSGFCPQCGKPLVERQGRYGRFLGCSGYPSCKFILGK